MLWGGTFWSGGYFISGVSKSGIETAIREYVRMRGKEKITNSYILTFASEKCRLNRILREFCHAVVYFHGRIVV